MSALSPFFASDSGTQLSGLLSDTVPHTGLTQFWASFSGFLSQGFFPCDRMVQEYGTRAAEHFWHTAGTAHLFNACFPETAPGHGTPLCSHHADTLLFCTSSERCGRSYCFFHNHACFSHVLGARFLWTGHVLFPKCCGISVTKALFVFCEKYLFFLPHCKPVCYPCKSLAQICGFRQNRQIRPYSPAPRCTSLAARELTAYRFDFLQVLSLPCTDIVRKISDLLRQTSSSSDLVRPHLAPVSPTVSLTVSPAVPDCVTPVPPTVSPTVSQCFHVLPRVSTNFPEGGIP